MTDMIELFNHPSITSWHLEEDDEGWRLMKISFEPCANDYSLFWKVCNELFGDSQWRIVSDEVKREVEIMPYGSRYLGEWAHTYVVERYSTQPSAPDEEEKGQGERPTVSEFLAVSAPYFRENPNGGSLHIVVADDNLENKSVEFCYLRALEDGDGYGAALALLLMKMTRSQRGRVAKRY